MVRLAITATDMATVVLSTYPGDPSLALGFQGLSIHVFMLLVPACELRRPGYTPCPQGHAEDQKEQIQGVGSETVASQQEEVVFIGRPSPQPRVKPLSPGEIEESQQLAAAIAESLSEARPGVRCSFLQDPRMTPSGGLANVSANAWELDSNSSKDSYHSAWSLGEQSGLFGSDAWVTARMVLAKMHEQRMQAWYETCRWIVEIKSTLRLVALPTVLCYAQSQQAELDMPPTSRADVLLFEAVMKSGYVTSCGRWWGDLPPLVRGRIAAYIGAVPDRPCGARRRANGSRLTE